MLQELISRQHPEKNKGIGPKIGRVVFRSKTQEAREVLDSLKNGMFFPRSWRVVQPAPQETVREGTRSYKTLTQSVGAPSRLVVISGLGVVQFNYGNLEVSPPHWNEMICNVIPGMGSMVIDNEGNIWNSSDTTVFGAYEMTSLRKKIAKTIAFSNIVNDASSLRIELAGTHKRNRKYGWLVYSLAPGACNLNDLIESDKNESGKSMGVRYYAYLRTLFSKISHLHSSGVVHLQLHPGNCLPVIVEGEDIGTIISDWETAESLSKLPQAKKLLKNGYSLSSHQPFEGLTPVQTAIAVDLFIAMENCEALPLALKENKLWKKATVKIETNIQALVQAALAYLNIDPDTADVLSIKNQMLKIVAELASRRTQADTIDSWLQLNKAFETNDESLVPEHGLARPEFFLNSVYREFKLILAGILSSRDQSQFFTFLSLQRPS